MNTSVTLIDSNTKLIVSGFVGKFNSETASYSVIGSDLEIDDSRIPSIGDTIMLEFPNEEGQILPKFYTVEKRVINFFRDGIVLRIKEEELF